MLNEKFFEINDEFAYIIGMLLTDGCISITNTSKGWHGYMSLSLKESDKYLIENIKNYLDPERNTHVIIRNSGFPGENLATFNMCDKNFLTRILSYGIVPHKTKIVSLPDIPNFEYALIRGIFDGDGSVWQYDQGKNFGFGIRTTFTGGCKNFLVQIGDLLKDKLGIIPKIYEASCGNDNWRLQYGARESIALYDYMYQNKNMILYHINRKKIFEDWLSYKGILNYKAKCLKCGHDFVRIRREKNFCNTCYKERKYRPIYEANKKHRNKLQSDLTGDSKLTQMIVTETQITTH
jgi:hypothetical protein